MRQLPAFADRRAVTPAAFVLLDEEDAARFEGRRLYLRDGYVRVGGKFLHRLLMGCTVHDGREVDHRNRDRLDCRRENLRLTTRQGNGQNVMARGGSSRFRGVSWYSPRGYWQATICIAQRHIKLGYRRSEVEAALLAHEARCRLMPFAEPDPELVKLGLA